MLNNVNSVDCVAALLGYGSFLGTTVLTAQAATQKTALRAALQAAPALAAFAMTASLYKAHQDPSSEDLMSYAKNVGKHFDAITTDALTVSSELAESVQKTAVEIFADINRKS